MPSVSRSRLLAVVCLSPLACALLSCGGSGSSSSSNFTVSLSAAARALEAGQKMNLYEQLSGSYSEPRIDWTLIGPGTITPYPSTYANVLLANSCDYQAPATLAAASSATVTGTPHADSSKAASLTIALVPKIVITTQALPAITAGVPYSTTIATSGGTPPITFTLSYGTSLPAGLTLDGSKGIISGTATSPGSYSFRLVATSSTNSQTATFADFSGTVL